LKTSLYIFLLNQNREIVNKKPFPPPNLTMNVRRQATSGRARFHLTFRLFRSFSHMKETEMFD